MRLGNLSLVTKMGYIKGSHFEWKFPGKEIAGIWAKKILQWKLRNQGEYNSVKMIKYLHSMQTE